MRIARWILAAAAAAVMLSASAGRLGAQPLTADDQYRAELEAHGSDEALADWRVDDGRSVSVLWDFGATQERHGIQPVIEVPSPGDYPWYSGSVAHILDPNAVLTPEGLMVLVAAGDEPIASAEDTNPTDPQVKESTISYWWKRAAGGTAPPGPTLQIDPPSARVVSIDRWPSHVYPGYEFVQVVVRFGPPCPAKVKGTLFQPPGGAEVVVKGIVISSTCGPTAEGTSSADAQSTTPGGGGDGGGVDILPVTFRAGGAETVDGEADGDVIAVRLYCVYSIMTVQGTCPGVGVGSKLCIDCPASNSCPGPAGGTPSGFRFVDANGNLVCSGTWVKHYNINDPSACIHCTNGRTGYVFVN